MEARRSAAFGVNTALGRGETKLRSFVSFIYIPIFLFYVKNIYKKKIGIEESVVLFWDSVLFGHLWDSFVLTESFANCPCLEDRNQAMIIVRAANACSWDKFWETCQVK